MPRPTDYTPTRRYLMQAIMTLILGATIVLAVLVGAHVRRTHRVELSENVYTAKDVSVRLPAQWQQRGVPDDPTVVVRAIEPGATRGSDGSGSRFVDVRVERLSTPLSPMQFLMSQLDIDPRDYLTGQETVEAVDVAGHTGAIMSFERGQRRRRGASRKDVIAAIVLPSMRGVVVHLQGPGAADAYDLAVVREIAAQMTVANEPDPGKPGESVTLVDGIRLTAPEGFSAAPQRDPSRTDRVLFSGIDDSTDDAYEVERDWMTVEAIGCLCPDFDPADTKQTERAKSLFTTLLLVRDPGWRGATITSLGGRTWRAEMSDPANSLPARAYLRTDPSGRALLAVLRGGFGVTDFDATWQSLAGSVTFLPSSDVASLEDVGTAEAARLRRAGHEKLLADRDVEWCLWTENERPIGWSMVEFSPGKLAGRATSRMRYAGGAAHLIVSLTADFYCKEPGAHYNASATRIVSDGRRRVESRASVTLDDGQLTLAYKHPGQSDLNRTTAPPPQYVPSAILPLVMGMLSKDPMVLVSDDGLDALGTPEPLTIVIRPGESRDAPPTSATTPVLRCVTAQVNGTGAVSRWHFRPTGEVDRVEWPGGVKQLTSDERAIRSAFPRGDEMAPP